MVASQAQNAFGHASTRTVSKCTGIPQRSVARIIRGLGLHPYKTNVCQQLQGGDMPKTVDLHSRFFKINHFLIESCGVMRHTSAWMVLSIVTTVRQGHKIY